jgi:hypothetical protein
LYGEAASGEKADGRIDETLARDCGSECGSCKIDPKIPNGSWMLAPRQIEMTSVAQRAARSIAHVRLLIGLVALCLNPAVSHGREADSGSQARDGQHGLATLPAVLGGSDFWIRRHGELVHIGELLRDRVARHNATCSSVASDDTPVNQACLQEQQALTAAIAARRREIASFNRDVAAAVASGDLRPTVKIGVPAVIRGDVYTEGPDGQRHKLTASDSLQLYDHVTSGPTGHLDIVLEDKTRFTIGPNADVILDHFVYDPDTSTTQLVLQVVKGQFRLVTGVLNRMRPDAFKVKLPVGTIGIRGTDVEVDLAPDGAGVIKLLSGDAVYVPDNGDPSTPLAAGQSVRVAKDGSLGEPTPVR